MAYNELARDKKARADLSATAERDWDGILETDQQIGG